MNGDKDHIKIAISGDSLPILLNTPERIEQYKQSLRNALEKNIDDMIKRYKELPSYLIGFGSYLELLVEARELYIEGKYYSCIAMCGVTAERIAKDLLFTLIQFEKKGKLSLANQKQFKLLDKIDLNIIRELLYISGVIDKPTKKAFIYIAELRNTYLHSVGNNKQNDAKKAIKYLHTIIDGSVSIYKYFDIKNGKLVEKN